jgi:thymidylate synthase
MKQYHEMLRHILGNGVDREDRTGTGTRSVFGYQNRFDLSAGLPVVTTKKVFLKGVIHELLWMLAGGTNNNDLEKVGVSIWREWADPDTGDLGPIYGKQWRSWNVGNGKTIDQIKLTIDEIKKNPNSRRLCISAWNPAEIDEMALPPCHAFFQFYVSDGKLSCHLYQRSGDAFLGVPFNITSYSILTYMIAHECGLRPGEFIHSFGDLHIYKNHFQAVKEILSRDPLPIPRLYINPTVRSVLEMKYDDIKVIDYMYWPAIKAEVSV